MNAIDRKNNAIKNFIERANMNIQNKSDVLFELYKENLLNPDLLNYIILQSNYNLEISSLLIKTLIKDNKNDLLDVIFKRIKIFDFEIIMELLLHYKNREPMSIEYLRHRISRDDYKLSKTNYLDDARIDDDYSDDELDDAFEEVRYSCNTYLYDSCLRGNMRTIRFLIEHGIDINKEDFSGKTALFFACKGGEVSVVKYLVKHGMNLNKVDRFGRTIFHYACKTKTFNEALIDYLIKQGADVNKGDKYGKISLHFACGNKALLRYLVEHGADINKEDNQGKTVFHCICDYFNRREKRNTSIIEYLIEHGADINKQDKFGQTPLHYACGPYTHNIPLAKCLVEHGADVNKEDHLGDTSIHYARMCQICDDDYLIKYLVEHFVDINRTDRG